MKIKSIEKITKPMLKGKLIAFPTDTVYGVGALIEDKEAIEKIYALKKRDIQKPLAILAGNIEDILPYIKQPNQQTLEMMRTYWPGALTILFEKSDLASDTLTRGYHTIGFRIPDEEDALQLLKKVGPLATTSVNLSGESPLNDAKTIEMHFGSQIDYIYDKEVKSSYIASTVVDCTTEKYTILRQGQIKIK